MEAPSRQRRVESAAGGSTSRHRLYSNDSDDNDNIDGNRPAPVRPSTHRATKSTPRAAAEAARRLSADPMDERAMGKVRLEVEALRDKLSEADLAKAQAQVHVTVIYSQIGCFFAEICKFWNNSFSMCGMFASNTGGLTEINTLRQV